MKKLVFVLFIIAVFVLFAIARIIFDTQYLQFLILSILLIAVNLFHAWFQTQHK